MIRRRVHAGIVLHLLGALLPFEPEPDDLPGFLVGDVKHRRDPVPTGRVCIHVQRHGVWTRTAPIEAAAVEWDRLLDNDRIEVLA